MGSGSYEDVLKKLEELESTSLPDSIKLYLRLTRLQMEARSDIEIKEARLSQKEIDERVGLGIEALKFEELQPDWARVEQLFKSALKIIGEYSPSVDAEDKLPLRQIVQSWYNKQSFPHDGMDEDILNVAVHTAVKPFLAKRAQALLPMIKQERWRRGYCPICAGTPNFAYLERESGARWLCCPRCDAEWLFQRIECPFCGNITQNELTYLKDRRGLYRIYTCEGCKGYLKAVDLRQDSKDIAMPLEWISTLDLDKQACERGYRAGTIEKKIDDRGVQKAP